MTSEQPSPARPKDAGPNEITKWFRTWGMAERREVLTEAPEHILWPNHRGGRASPVLSIWSLFLVRRRTSGDRDHLRHHGDHVGSSGPPQRRGTPAARVTGGRSTDTRCAVRKRLSESGARPRMVLLGARLALRRASAEPTPGDTVPPPARGGAGDASEALHRLAPHHRDCSSDGSYGTRLPLEVRRNRLVARQATFARFTSSRSALS